MQEVRELLMEASRDTVFAGNVYLVGGAVRDHLLGKEDIWDFDVCVELEQGGIRFAKKLRGMSIWDSNHVNKKFGFVRLNYANFLLELNGSRKERYKKGSRYPQIVFGNLMEDVYRRDFTVNSLYMEVCSGDIIDLSGYALPDLEQGLIRTLKDPDIVLSEDPLRILRAVRFAAKLDFQIEDSLLAALKASAPLLQQLSHPNLMRELQLMLEYDGAAKANALLAELEMYQYMPSFKVIKKLKKQILLDKAEPDAG